MQKATEQKIRFFIGWCFSNTIGMITGAGFVYVMSGGFGAPPPLIKYLYVPIGSFLVGMIFGLILSLFQLIVLASQIKDAFAWLSATSLGAGLGLTMMFLLITSISFFDSMLVEIPFLFTITSLLPIALPFGLMGIFQWLVLRKQVSGIKSSAWIVLNVIIGIGMGVGRIWGDIGMALCWIIGSVFSGITIIWLLKNQFQESEITSEQ